MLTRKQAAEVLGRSVSTVRRMEGTTLTPTVDENGVYQFDEDEVEEVRRAILRTGRALPSGAAQEAIDLAREDKKMLADHLEHAELTVRRLRHQILDLQHRISMGRLETGAAPGPYATIYRHLREDVKFLIRQIPTPSFRTELAIVRVTTVLKGL